MSTDAFDEVRRPQTVEAEIVDDAAADLFGPSDAPQLPAAPRHDAFAPYLQLGLQARATGARLRGDDVALQNAAKRVGSLTGEDGFYSFPIAGGRVEGPSIRLAKALAVKYGFVAFGVEIERIDGDMVYLTGVCLDLLAFVTVRRGYVFTIAPPPQKFAAKADQRERWRAMQIQAAGAKALRGAILDCLPSWFVSPAFEAAKDAARKRILREGETIEGARESAVKHFAGLQVTRAELEALEQAPMIEWTVDHIADLRELAKALKTKEATIEEVFGPIRSAAPAPTSGDGRDSLGLGKGRKKKTEEKSADKPTEAKPSGSASPKSPIDVVVYRIREAEAEAGEGAVVAARAKVGVTMAMSAIQLAEQWNDPQIEAYVAALGGAA